MRHERDPSFHRFKRCKGQPSIEATNTSDMSDMSERFKSAVVADVTDLSDVMEVLLQPQSCKAR